MKPRTMDRIRLAAMLGTEKGTLDMNLRMWLLGLFATAMAVGFGSPAIAADPVDPSNGPGKPYLVSIGVGEFRDKAIHPRPTADADAKALYGLLTNKAVLGIPADRAKLLTSADATREGIVKAIDTAVDATSKGDLLIIAFFGSGSSVADKPCFFTPESVFKDRAKTTLTPNELEPAFKKIKGQKLLLLMDVTYKGFDAGEEKVLEPSVAPYIKLVFGEDDREDSSLQTDRVIVLGNLPFRLPLTKGGHGLFYTVLAEGLGGKSDQKPYFIGDEPDGLVTVAELAKYLEKEIPNGAREVGKNDKEKELFPYIIGQSTSRFWVSHNPAETDKVTKRLDTIAALVKDGKMNEADGKEATGLIFRMPRLKWQQDLRKAYQNLADGKVTVDEALTTRKTLRDSLKLPAEDAAAYAKKVEDWTSELSARYIKPFTTGELTAAAIKGMYSRAEEPLPVDLEDALKKPKELSREQQDELLMDARMRLGRREDLDGDKAVDVSLAMASGSLGDRYSIYTDKAGVLKMQSQLQGRFPGVGIQIRRDAVRDGLLVATPIKGSPAYKAGIQAGDLITEIRLDVDKFGNPLPADAQKVHSTKGMKTEDAVSLILGAPDSPVTLMVQREGLKDLKEFKIFRNFVMVETVHGVQRDKNADWNFFIDEKNKIGYVHITQFIAIDLDEDGREEFGTVTDLKKAIAQMKKTGLNGLIIDLRENPGGYLSSAWHLCEMFIDKGEKVVTVKPRAGAIREYKAEIQGDKSFEVVVLVNGNSASASEIVAACLQDHGRATIVGERSYGKGSVQDVREFKPTGGQLKYTIARYYPPTGRNIDKLATEQDPTIKEWGVKPDPGFEVKLSSDELNDWYEYAQNLLVIEPPGKESPKVNPAKDKQLLKGLEQLRDILKSNGKAPKG
ncbi:MAG: S41 family peptidase [Planctomycetes bacterium]|nr:S41 family peptidase [Planctomycetota bacterium]